MAQKQGFEIIIRKSGSGSLESNQEFNNSVVEESNVSETSSNDGIKNQAITSAIINASREVMNQGINQYGNLTGNYIASQRINDMINISSLAADIIVNPIVGSIRAATTIGINAFQNYVELEKNKVQLEFQRQLAGEISKNGSRY